MNDVYRRIAANEQLEAIRSTIDVVDGAILQLILLRHILGMEIGQIKKNYEIPVIQTDRQNEVIARLWQDAKDMGLDPEIVPNIWRHIQEDSIAAQARIIGNGTI